MNRWQRLRLILIKTFAHVEHVFVGAAAAVVCFNSHLWIEVAFNALIAAGVIVTVLGEVIKEG